VARRTSGYSSSPHEGIGSAVPNVSRLVVVISCLAAVGAMFGGLLGLQPSGETKSSTTVPPPTPAPTTYVLSATSPPAAAPTEMPTAIPTPAVPHIGIVAGHWGNDTGAVCPDGLQEVDINLDVAKRVVHILQAHDYRVDLLQEFDAQLTGYQADALLSIHADSCIEFTNATPPASGFKVASVVDSAVPEEEDRLVECLTERYRTCTGMFFHANSITSDMSQYHTFYEIDGETPGAIIETGFMFTDRALLTDRADLVAQGIAEGIVCFIENETP
jgi:N-acetylmuramoyl-L-alanine amidase